MTNQKSTIGNRQSAIGSLNRLELRILLTCLLLAGCNHFGNSIETVDGQQGIYRISTKDKDPGVLKTVEDNGICPNFYTVEKIEPKIQKKDGPIFYDVYTIKCLPKLLAPSKIEE